MAKRTLWALVLPVLMQVLVILLYQRLSLNLLETARDFTAYVLMFSLFLGPLVLIPMGIAQIVSVTALVRSKCSNRALILAGILNPAIALFVIYLVGWLSLEAAGGQA